MRREFDSFTLDQWYKEINEIYLQANFYRTKESIFAHFVELYGLLSPSSTARKRREIGEDELIAKAIGWLMTLCGKVGVPSMQAMLWAKFPLVCPYCLSNPHQKARCEESRRQGIDIQWDQLYDISKENLRKRPLTLVDWQKMFNDIYGQFDEFSGEDFFSSKKGIFIKLGEEN